MLSRLSSWTRRAGLTNAVISMLLKNSNVTWIRYSFQAWRAKRRSWNYAQQGKLDGYKEQHSLYLFYKGLDDEARPRTHRRCL
jgi:hypothetical protein